MATIISNQASLSYTFAGATETRNVTSNIANTTLLDDYSLEVSQINYQDCFTPGENITYAVKITNTGSKQLKDFIVSDTIGIDGETCPLHYLNNSARVSINGQFTSINPTSTEPLSFTFPDTLTPNGSMIITYVMKVDSNISNNLMEICKTAVVTATSTIDSEKSISAESTNTIPRLKEANLVITKQVSKSRVTSSEDFDYIITIKNTGLADATNVVITDQLPQGFIVNSVKIHGGGYTKVFDTNEYSVDENNILTVPSRDDASLNIKSSTDNDISTIVSISGKHNT